jgi:hypothetical protein
VIGVPRPPFQELGAVTTVPAFVERDFGIRRIHHAPAALLITPFTHKKL